MIKVRKGQAPAPLTRAEFGTRFRAGFADPAFRAEDASLARLEEIAWQAYTDYRKSPFTQKAGPGFADPDYDLSSEWLATKQRIDEAQQRQADPASPSRVLLVCGAAIRTYFGYAAISPADMPSTRQPIRPRTNRDRARMAVLTTGVSKIVVCMGNDVGGAQAGGYFTRVGVDTVDPRKVV